MKRYRTGTILAIFLLASSAATKGYAEIPIDSKAAEVGKGSRFDAHSREFPSHDNVAEKSKLSKNPGKTIQPEIILKEGNIFINSSAIALGESLQSWKKLLPGYPRCYARGINVCTWDEIGLEIGTNNKNSQAVTFVNIYLNFSEFDTQFLKHYARGGVVVEESIPDKAFQGYFEFDGFRISSETEFSAVRVGTRRKNALHCGLRDCSHPSGPFGEFARTDLILDGRHENSVIRRFSISLIE